MGRRGESRKAAGGEKNMPVLFLEKKDCCGCAACYSVCPFGAISMERDEEGFLYPKIHEEKCRRCGLCKRCCVME